MARKTIMRELSGDMIRIGCSVEFGLMTTETVGRKSFEHTVLVTVTASNCRMRSNELEAGGSMTEC